MRGHCHDRTHFWGRHMHCCHWGPWLLHRNCHHGPSWGGYLAMNSYHGHAWYRHLNCIAWICNSDILAGRKASLVRIILKEGKFQRDASFVVISNTYAVNTATSCWVLPSLPREASAIQAENFHPDDVNLPRLQASLLNGYSTPLLV